MFTILVALLCLGVSQALSSYMPADIKTKYEAYLREFDNQRGQNPGNAQFKANKKSAILFMKSKFEAAGLTVHLQNFTSTDTNDGQAVNGTNLIAVLPGSSYKTAQDEVVVLAANIDTYGIDAGGVDNDGTGLVGLLAIAEDLAGPQKCTLKNSIIFAAFDLSETGGSYTYCNRSCGSIEFLRNKATYIGSGKIQLAMVMDCIGNFDKSENSQHYPQSLEKIFHSLVLQEKLTDSWGDYLAISGRSDDGSYLQDFERFYTANKVQETDFKLHKFQWDIQGVPTAQNRSSVVNGFKGGDYLSFWDANINAILLSDTCYNRGYMKSCKSDKTCDTISKMSTIIHGYEFMYSAVYSAMRLTKNLTCAGSCASCSPLADCKNNLCVCKANYTGNGVTCTAIACASCSPYAKCQNDQCVCKAGYVGDGNNCTSSCAICSPFADCNNNLCVCKAGYTGNGVTCTAIACASCSPYAKCQNDQCVCKAGYTGDGNTCTTIACASCSPYAKCQNDQCVCKAGYTGDGNTCKKSGSSLVLPHQLLISSSVLLSLVVILSNVFLYKTG